MPKAAITATGHYVPPDVYPNAWFEQRLDTTDAWIRARTGIVERRFASEGGVSDLALPPAPRCREMGGMGAASLDFIVVGRWSPSPPIPSTAAILQAKLGAINAWGFDLAGACSGFVYALVTATKLVEGGAARRVLVCSADRMSSVVDPTDRATAVLFGDGAGVVLVEMSEDDEVGVFEHVCHMDGEGAAALYIPAGGSLIAASAESVAHRRHFVVQDGAVVFKAAVVGMAEITEELLKRADLKLEDVAWMVPHQANRRIIEAVARRLGLPLERVVINLDRYGNTVAATIPLCLSARHDHAPLAYGD